MIGEVCVDIQTPGPVPAGLLPERLGLIVDDLIAALPPTEGVCAEERRGIIARYCVVLEGNFIYWMTAALLSATTEEARCIIRENLFEEVRDCHPGMLRNFAMASHSVPEASDSAAIYPELAKVRLFLGKLSPVPLIAMMAFFEEFIRKFMPYLAELARLQGSNEFEYTTVHSICDLVHTQELFKALAAETAALAQPHDPSEETVLEGIQLLHALIRTILAGSGAQGAEPDGKGGPTKAAAAAGDERRGERRMN